MPRVKRGTIKKARKSKIIKLAKGFRWGRKNKYRAAKEAIMKAWSYKYRDRKVKKRNFRRKWQVIIGSACKENKISYSEFIFNLKKNKVSLDRKILADLAKNNPETLKNIIEETK